MLHCPWLQTDSTLISHTLQLQTHTLLVCHTSPLITESAAALVLIRRRNLEVGPGSLVHVFLLMVEPKSPFVGVQASTGLLLEHGILFEIFQSVSIYLDLMGSFTIFLFLVRSHILNSNGVKVPCAASGGPMWRCESRYLWANLKPQKIEFGAFIGPSGQNQLYHTSLLFKI